MYLRARLTLAGARRIGSARRPWDCLGGGYFVPTRVLLAGDMVPPSAFLGSRAVVRRFDYQHVSTRMATVRCERGQSDDSAECYLDSWYKVVVGSLLVEWALIQRRFEARGRLWSPLSDDHVTVSPRVRRGVLSLSFVLFAANASGL